MRSCSNERGLTRSASFSNPISEATVDADACHDDSARPLSRIYGESMAEADQDEAEMQEVMEMPVKGER